MILTILFSVFFFLFLMGGGLNLYIFHGPTFAENFRVNLLPHVPANT